MVETIYCKQKKKSNLYGQFLSIGFSTMFQGRKIIYRAIRECEEENHDWNDKLERMDSSKVPDEKLVCLHKAQDCTTYNSRNGISFGKITQFR